MTKEEILLKIGERIAALSHNASQMCEEYEGYRLACMDISDILDEITKELDMPPIPSNLDEAAEESLEKEQPQGLDEPRTIGKGIHKQEYTGCDMSWMDEWKYASKGLDEAAEEYAWEKQEHHIDFDGDEYLDYGPRYDAFKSGAKWMAEHGVTKEAIIGMATKDIEINVSGRVLDELDLCPGDKVVVQIRKK